METKRYTRMFGYYSKKEVKEIFKKFINSEEYRCHTWFMRGKARDDFKKYMETDYNTYIDDKKFK